jgi:hypothetical protein
MYCIIKCVKTKHVLKGNFALSVFRSCNAKTQKTQICVTGPQCVKKMTGAQKVKQYIFRNPKVLNSTATDLIQSHMNSTHTVSC